MAKPKVRSAEITSLLGGAAVSKAPAASQRSVTEGGHPVRDRVESGVARAENVIVLQPGRVVRRGTYVRPFTEDARFRELMAAIREAGNVIHVPIIVRVEGDPGAIEYVLVDGTHRLEAAKRLNLPVPAVNLGRISPDRALAIQAMSNEVRAAMHVVDQATYVIALAAQGLSREAVQRTTGFSAGRVSELLNIGGLLDVLSEQERAKARRAARVTHRALRNLKSVAADRDAFRAGVRELIDQSEREENTPSAESSAVVGAAFLPPGRSKKERVVREKWEGKRPRADESAEAPNVTFVSTRNERGTSVTYRVAWRARVVRSDPDGFITQINDLLKVIAAEATAQYQAAVNPMPMPASQRKGEDAAPTIDPRLLSGLSLPMLARRIVKRT